MSHDRRLALVTGASGFIGRRLCIALAARGLSVRALMRRRASGPWNEQVAHDICRPIPARMLEGADTVFHLAGKAHAIAELRADTDEYHEVNAAGTAALVDEALQAGVRRFVLFSSVKAMGEGGEACLDERAPCYPETPYGRSKLAAERALLARSDAGALHGAVLRLPLVYGPGMKGNLASMLDAVARGRFPPVGVRNKRSMVHVADVVEAAILAAESPRACGEVYIVTDGEVYSTSAIHAMMCRALGRSEPRRTLPIEWLAPFARLGDFIGRLRGRRVRFDSDALAKLGGSAWYDAMKIRNELGFAPRHTLQSALPAMVLRSVNSHL